MLCLQYFSFVSSWNLFLVIIGILLILISIWLGVLDLLEGAVLSFFLGMVCVVFGFTFAHSDAWRNEVRQQIHTSPGIAQILSIQDKPATLYFLDNDRRFCKERIYDVGITGHKYYFLDHSTLKCHKEVVPSG